MTTSDWAFYGATWGMTALTAQLILSFNNRFFTEQPLPIHEWLYPVQQYLYTFTQETVVKMDIGEMRAFCQSKPMATSL